MRLFWILLILAFGNNLMAQEASKDEIFQLVEEMPRFPGCEDQTLSKKDLNFCAQQKMLEFVYANITYPEKAREEGIEGTTVIKFVILEDGSISQAKIVKEIGAGCGEEALRVVNLMNEKGIQWIPGKQRGEAVKVYFNLPVKYKLQEEAAPPPPPLPYFLAGPDTIYTEYDEFPVYGKKGELKTYLESIAYPAGVDSCVAGSLVTQLFVSKTGVVKIGDMYDYSNLGFDYQFEAIKLLNATNLKWTPAKREGRAVNVFIPLRIVFKPTNKECATVAENYDLAYAAAAEAEGFYANGEVAEAIAKWDESLALMPDNTEFLLLRGQAFLEINEKEKACTDLTTAKRTVPLAAWVEQMLPFICVKTEE